MSSGRVPGIALVTDSQERAALAVVRSLGRAGWTVFTCSHRKRSLAGASRFCRRHFVVPEPLRDPGAFAEAVVELTRREGPNLLMPVSEATLLALLPRRAELTGATLPFASEAAFRRICDKGLVLDAARGLGIRTPDEWRLESPQQPFDPRALRFPLAVKPSRSVSEAGEQRIKLGVAYAENADQLNALLASIPAAAYPLLLQRRVHGAGIGVFLLNWAGRELAAFSHRRLREKPPSGGVSVYRESIPLDPVLLQHSRALLQHFDWEGVAMIEYKLDRDGTPYLMEINGRLWGSLQLAIDAGVDFPRLLVEAATASRPPTSVDTYRTGIRSRWWWGDVDHLLARLRRSREALFLPPEAPSRTRVVLDFLRLWRRGDRNEVLHLNDPLPFTRETLDWLVGRAT